MEQSSSSAALQPEGLRAADLPTPLLIEIAIPALNVVTQLSFQFTVSRQGKVLDAVDDLVQRILDDLRDELISCDKDGSLRKLEHLKNEAISEAEEWKENVKLVDEWKEKVKRTKSEMNKMRDTYFKDLFHLREQVYQKKRAEVEGRVFQPVCAARFDPSNYVPDDDVARIVADKVSCLQQEFETKQNEEFVKHTSRVRVLNEQLKTAKMVSSRQEKLIVKFMREHHIENEGRCVLDELSSLRRSERKKEMRLGQCIERAEQKVREQQQQQCGSLSENSADGVSAFQNFLERRFGSMKEAKIHIGLKCSLDNNIGLGEFKDLCNQIGYVCDSKIVFLQLTGGAPFAPLRSMMDRPSHARRASDVGSNSLPSFDGPNCVDTPFGKRRRASGAGLGKQPCLGAIAELDLPSSANRQSQLDDVSESDFSDHVTDITDEDTGSESSFASSCAASETSAVSKTGTGKKKLNVTLAVRKAGSILTKKVRGAKAAKLARGSRTDACIETETTFDTGIVAAFSGSIANFTFARQTLTEVGTDAQHFQDAFPKIKLRSRFTQSQIDGRLLDKANDFFDKQAEHTWNMLIDFDGDSVPSTPRDRPSSRNDCGVAADCGTGIVVEDGDVDPTTCVCPGISMLRDEDTSPIEKRMPSNSDYPKLINEDTSTDPQDGCEEAQCTGDIDCTTPVLRASVVDPKVAASVPCAPVRNAVAVSSVGIQEVPETAGIGIQCLMHRIVKMSPLECWYPSEDNPREIQLQQIIDMANEIEDKIPELRSRAEKLLAGANYSSERQQQLTEQLMRLGFMQSPPSGEVSYCPGKPVPRRPSFTCAKTSIDKDDPLSSIDSLLKRHGVIPSNGVELENKDPDGGRLSNASRAITAVPNPGLRLQRARRRSCEAKISSPLPPVNTAKASARTESPQALTPGWSGLLPEASFTSHEAHLALDAPSGTAFNPSKDSDVGAPPPCKNSARAKDATKIVHTSELTFERESESRRSFESQSFGPYTARSTSVVSDASEVSGDNPDDEGHTDEAMLTEHSDQGHIARYAKQSGAVNSNRMAIVRNQVEALVQTSLAGQSLSLPADKSCSLRVADPSASSSGERPPNFRFPMQRVSKVKAHTAQIRPASMGGMRRALVRKSPTQGSAGQGGLLDSEVDSHRNSVTSEGGRLSFDGDSELQRRTEPDPVLRPKTSGAPPAERRTELRGSSPQVSDPTGATPRDAASAAGPGVDWMARLQSGEGSTRRSFSNGGGGCGGSAPAAGATRLALLGKGQTQMGEEVVRHSYGGVSRTGVTDTAAAGPVAGVPLIPALPAQRSSTPKRFLRRTVPAE